jgi:hypothetical protein
VQVTRPLVLPTEIVNLPNLTGYLRFGRDLPVIRFTDRYHPGKVREPAYIDRTEPAIRLDPAPYPAIDDRPVKKPKGFKRVAKSDKSPAVDAAGTTPGEADAPLPAAHGGLIGPRSGASSSIRQQSRPNGPFRPANPA